MPKVIELEMKSGRIYHIPLEQIAENRAKYYAEKDKDTTFDEEVNFVMDDGYEGLDWYMNNMNPEDVKPTLVKDVTPLNFEQEEVDDYRIKSVSSKGEET